MDYWEVGWGWGWVVCWNFRFMVFTISVLTHVDRLLNSQKQREGGVLEFAVSGFRYHCT